MKDKKTKRKFKPEKLTVRLNERVLPEIKDLEVGEETTITIRVRMKSKSQGNEYGDIEGGDWYEDEYGAEYAEQRRKEDSQLKGSFEILSADETPSANTSPEARIAAKFNASRKKGMSASSAMNVAKKG